MSLKKILASTMAAALAVGSMAVCASADDAVATAAIVWADGVGSYWWNADDNAGIENNTLAITEDGTYSIKADVAQIADGEEVDGGCTDVKVLTLDLTFADGVKLEEAYPDARVEVTSVKLGDTALTLDFSKVKEKLESPVGDSANNYEKDNVLRQNIYNDWGGQIYACELPADLAYESITIDFKVTGIKAADVTTSEEAAATDASEAATTTAAAGDVNQSTEDKNSPDTGVEGVAVVAGLAVIAAGAIVVAKKRK